GGGRGSGRGVGGKARAPLLPAVPPFGEPGLPVYDPLFVSTSMLAPAGTPQPIIAALNRELIACQDKPDIKERMEKGSYEQGYQSLDEVVAFFDADYKNWSEVIRETGVRIKTCNCELLR